MASTTSSKDIFYTVDPLKNIVYLTENRMYNHISINHPEMAGQEKSIQLTVENPDSMYKDKAIDGTVCYISSHNNTDLAPHGDYLKVVVDRDLQGQVITAYPTGMKTDKGLKIYSK